MSNLNSDNVIIYVVGERLSCDTKGNIYHMPGGKERKVTTNEARTIAKRLLESGGVKGSKYNILQSGSF